MKTLYPIIRRKRRPLLPVDAATAVVPAVPVVPPVVVTPLVENKPPVEVAKPTRRSKKAETHD